MATDVRYMDIVSFFFNDTATTEIYTLSLHDALPICVPGVVPPLAAARQAVARPLAAVQHAQDHRGAIPADGVERVARSEEHTSELQSRQYLVCRLLLEKKKNLNVPRSILSLPLLTSA